MKNQEVPSVDSYWCGYRIRHSDGSYICGAPCGKDGIRLFTKDEAEDKLDYLDNHDVREGVYFIEVVE